MPHKLNYEYRYYDTPYGESYSVDTKLWYDDGKEEFPQPQAKPEKPEDFRIASLIGIGEWNFADDFCDLDEENIKLMVDVCFDKGFDDAYCFGFYMAWKNNMIVFHWAYRYNKRHLEKFIKKIKKDEYACFYTNEYSDYKIFSYPIDNNKIRLIVQEYNDNSPEFLQNVFDGIVDKRYFVLTLSSIVKNAEEYLLDYIYAYAKEHNITGETLKKAIRIAKDKE